MGILLVYDVCDERTFNNIRNWIRNIEKHATESVNKILIGNKCDMVDKKVIDAERGQALANEYGIKFLETSAKNSINVEEAFITLAKAIKERLIDSRPNGDGDGSKGKPNNDIITIDGNEAPAANNNNPKKGGGCGCSS